MNRDEVKQEAERLGMKVKDNFLADLGYNALYMAIGLVLGRLGFPWFF